MVFDLGKIAKINDSNFDFKNKSIPKIKLNTKVTQKPSETITNFLCPKKKNSIHFYEYNYDKFSIVL